MVGDRPDKPGWPHFEEDDIIGLVDQVEKMVLTAPKPRVTMKVNGRQVPMLTFVQEMIENVVVGLVACLKNCDQPISIEVKINRGAD